MGIGLGMLFHRNYDNKYNWGGLKMNNFRYGTKGSCKVCDDCGRVMLPGAVCGCRRNGHGRKNKN